MTPSVHSVSELSVLELQLTGNDGGPITQICVPLPPWAVRAGARKKIYFDPAKVNAAIVTCGGQALTSSPPQFFW